MGNKPSPSLGFDRVDHFYMLCNAHIGRFRPRAVRVYCLLKSRLESYILALHSALARGDKWIVILHDQIDMYRADALVRQFFKQKRADALLFHVRPSGPMGRVKRVERFSGMLVKRKYAKKLLNEFNTYVWSRKSMESVIESLAESAHWYR